MTQLRQLLLALFLCAAFICGAVAEVGTSGSQTNVDQATHVIDAEGVPQLSIEGVGTVSHPAWTALYALAYAGVEDYEPSLGLKPNPQRFAATVDWLKSNLVQDRNGLWVWLYNFDSTYNDVSIKAPWSSAFAQATGIQALLAHWKRTGDKGSLEVAKKAAQSLFVTLDQGGFLFRSGDDIWFEEVPEPADNPSHILNGHMRVLLALSELVEATNDNVYAEWFSKGSDTLLRWLPLYDAGYWLRYDLNPRKEELLFRLANPYGFTNPDVAIDRIVLRDPLTGEESVLDVGGQSDAEGPLRIAGNDWGQVEQLDGRFVRRLRPVESEREVADSEGQMVSPFSYFYLRLPGKWQNNLRKAPYELSIEYLDERPANLEIQLRSISPGRETFKKLKDSDLLISGKGAWRQWRVNIYPSDLGYWVGMTYSKKHTDYLRILAKSDHRLVLWAEASKGYSLAIEPGAVYNDEPIGSVDLPKQTPMLPIYSLDKDGVLMQHMASRGSKFDARGLYDPSSDRGVPVYSPFIIATQLVSGPETAGGAYSDINKTDIQRSPALSWFLNENNQVRLRDAVVYEFPFPNVYNDVSTSPPWPSAFSQAYVLKALRYALNNSGAGSNVRDILKRVAYAYDVDVREGGISTLSKSGYVYFEEVPNATHVLNAHLISVPELAEVAKELGDSRVSSLVESGLETLKANLFKFDTGYWLRYDLNPKKEILFQLDWLSGDASPLIEDISLEAPQFAKKNRLYVGSEKAFEGASRISGLEWQPVQQVDGKQVRAFANGYLAHKAAVQGGTRHNVYVVMRLPETKFSDYFDVQPHRLVVRYKDVAAGQFVVKLQSINEGNVLDFTPLRNSVITTVGDQQWKEAIVEVRPQDMGWYKGGDYQVFEVEQLERIAKLTGDWFFAQYAERQRYYLETKAKDESVIIQPAFRPAIDPVGLSVLQASATYEGYGFENALDGDLNDNYVAGVEGGGLAFVELKLDRPVASGALTITWENLVNFPRQLRLFELAADQSKGRLIDELMLSKGGRTDIVFSLSYPVQALRLEFSDFSGQPRILLREIGLDGHLVQGYKSKSITDEIRVLEHYIEADDLRNPLHLFRLPVTDSIKRLSDDMVDSVGSEHEKVVRLMSYMHDFEVGIPSDSSPDGVVKERIGACGNFTVLLLAMAGAQGFEGRVVNLYNYPKEMGHTVAEIFIDGQWRLYDPTFEGYYVDRDAGVNEALSFEQIVQGYTNGRRIEFIFENPRSGIESFSGKDIYLKANPKGVIGPTQPMLFPLALDLNAISSVQASAFGTRFQGGNYIGAAQVNQSHEWTLSGLQPGQRYSFRIAPSGLGGDLKPNDVFTLIAHVQGRRLEKDFTSADLAAWDIEFEATVASEKIVLTHEYSGERYFYIAISSVEVVKS